MASIAVAAPVVLHKPWMNIPTAHVEILAGAAAVGSVFAELFMIKSLLVFDPKTDEPEINGANGPTSPRYKQSVVRGGAACLHACTPWAPACMQQCMHAIPAPLLGSHPGNVRCMAWA